MAVVAGADEDKTRVHVVAGHTSADARVKELLRTVPPVAPTSTTVLISCNV